MTLHTDCEYLLHLPSSPDLFPKNYAALRVESESDDENIIFKKQTSLTKKSIFKQKYKAEEKNIVFDGKQGSLKMNF